MFTHNMQETKNNEVIIKVRCMSLTLKGRKTNETYSECLHCHLTHLPFNYQDIDPEVMEELLRFIYTNKVQDITNIAKVCLKH